MEFTIVYAILLILSEYTSIDAFPDLSKKLRNQQPSESVHKNQTGLDELPNILGKQNLVLIRRNFQLLEKEELSGFDKKHNNDFDLEEEPPKLTNSNDGIEDNENSDQTRMVEVLEDLRLLGIGVSKDANGGHRREKIDLIELHKLSIIANPDKLSVMTTPKPRTVVEAEKISRDDQNKDNSQSEGNKQIQSSNDNIRDGIEIVNKLGFVSNFFVREIKFNCIEGKYYKRDACNICFCTKGSQWKPCTKVKCAKEHSDLAIKATGCIPGQKIKSHGNDDKCACVCALPSVMQCPLCAAAEHINIQPDKDKKSKETV